jgi:hypothetical protein
MQQIGGGTSEQAMGDRDSTVSPMQKAWYVSAIYQIDVLHNDASKRDIEADKIIHCILDHRDQLKTDYGIEVEHEPRHLDMPPDQVGTRLFRKVIEARFKIRMTAALS